MATTPNYEGTKRQRSYILTNGDGTTLTAAVMSGVAAGTRVKEIRVHSGPTTAPGASLILNVILDDGTNATIIDIVSVTNAASTYQAVLRYDNVFLTDPAFSIKFKMSAALAAGSTLHCQVFGADF